ncbi:hypothetical protein BJ980_002527 [Nocardioides daedukensis]|uniref:Uncharacterized protein n=1 Tax=Nocardioides daedukensis TaxID=634462 RepID=A0A7Y9S4K1_9ACTN|nr:hypothetical protein [Nocardioides daedukensis]
MRNRQSNDRPVMTWVEVCDALGRTRMEAQWVDPDTVHAAQPHAA